MRYEGQVFRPFSEANSYLLQCTIGCSHNRCTFCGMYKDKTYRVRSLAEIKEDIQMAQSHYGDLEKVFLCDGDAIDLPTDMLRDILRTLYEAFPSLRHVGTYVGPQSTLQKSASELAALRAEGLTKAYLGVETGDDQLLNEIKKGVGHDEMLAAGRNLVNAGINLSAMVLVGIAGKGQRAMEHAESVARITNAMAPQYLAALTVTPVPHTPLYQKVITGKFELPDPFETLEEIRVMIDGITLDGIKFVGTHASNYLPIKGELARDKAMMLGLIDQVLTVRDMNQLRPENMRGL